MGRRLPNSAGCFVCGGTNPRGLGVRFEVDSGVVVGHWVPHRDHCGYNDRVHGGVMAALLDEVMGWAPSVLKRRFCVAAEIIVRYLKPLPIGRPVTVRGELTADRGRVLESRGEIVDGEGTVYARGTGRYRPLTEEQTQAVMDYLSVDGKRVSLAEALGEAAAGAEE
jgi:acyl-coenzyme A thioesterase PaaI-like protein